MEGFIEPFLKGAIFTGEANETRIILNRFPKEGTDVGDQGIMHSCPMRNASGILPGATQIASKAALNWFGFNPILMGASG